MSPDPDIMGTFVYLICGALSLASAEGVSFLGALSVLYLRTASYNPKTTNIPVGEQRVLFSLDSEGKLFWNGIIMFKCPIKQQMVHFAIISFIFHCLGDSVRLSSDVTHWLTPPPGVGLESACTHQTGAPHTGFSNDHAPNAPDFRTINWQRVRWVRWVLNFRTCPKCNASTPTIPIQALIRVGSNMIISGVTTWKGETLS